MSEYKCQKCGNNRLFYNEVSVMAKELIDQKDKEKDGKIIDIEVNMVANMYEPVYCYECGEKVDD